MSKLLSKKETLEKYLLGGIVDKNLLVKIETSLFTDEDFLGKVEIVESELIDDYVNNLLEGEKLADFKKFFLSNPTRRKKVLFAQKLKEELEKIESVDENLETNTEEKPGFWKKYLAFLQPTPQLGFAFVLLIVLGLSLAFWLISSQPKDSDKYIVKLNKLYKNERPLESRINNFDYARYGVLRGKKNDEKLEDIKEERLRIERELLRTVKENPSVKSHNTLGVFYLTEKSFDKAIRHFKKALNLSPEDAESLGNLGTAYFERAKRKNKKDAERFKGLAESFEEISKALKSGDKRLGTLFNKALILQEMNVPRQAIKAWRTYLEKDKSSKWAEEARRNLKELEENKENKFKTKEQVLNDFLKAFQEKDKTLAWKIHSQTKEVNAQKFLPIQLARSYLEAEAKKDLEESEKYLKALNYIGELEKEKNADIFFADLAGFYSKIDKNQKNNLLQAHKFLAEGLKNLSSSTYGVAVEKLKKSRKLFLLAGSEQEVATLEVPLAFCLTRTTKRDESNRILARLENLSRRKNYKWLLSASLDWKVSNQAINNEVSNSIKTAKEVLRLAEETENIYEIQRISEFLSYLHYEIGETRNALKYLNRINLIKNVYNKNYKQEWRNYKGPSELFSTLGHYEAAIIFGQEYIQIAKTLKTDPSLLKLSYYLLSQVYIAKADYDTAREHLNKGKKVDLNSSQNHVQKSLTSVFKLNDAHIKRKENDCKGAIKAYDEAINTFLEHSKFLLEVFIAQKGKLLCHWKNDEQSLVESEIQKLLDSFERNRLQIFEELFRNTFFHNEQTIYDIAIDVALNKNDKKEAFEYSEESKARSLLDFIQNGAEVTKEGLKYNSASKPFSLYEIQKRMPRESQLIQYALLPKKVVAWVIQKDSFELVEKEISIEELNQQINDYRKILKEEKDDVEKIKVKSNQLYEALIAPLISKLDSEKEVFIVSDKSLHKVPFASLFSKKRGKYFIEDFTIASTPSATVFVLMSENAREKAEGEFVLSIGNPSFNQAEHPHLDDLKFAKREAMQISKLYKEKRVFVEENATKKGFLQNFDKAEIIHFAGHYVANEKSPINSRLLMAKNNTNDEDDLRVLEIAKKRGEKLKLVILSACQTDVEKVYSGEGSIGAARIFLAIGSPIVVASYFEVDSESTAELMINFHKYRRHKNLSVTKALRQAQIDAINNERSMTKSPFYWSAFSATGGATNY